MKNQLLISLLLFSWILPGNAQKVKDKRVTIKYVAFPAQKLPLDYTTYSVQVYGANVSKGGLTADGLEKSVKMDGFKRVESSLNEYGHLRVSVNTGSSNCGRPEFKSKTTTTKDDKGVETKTTTYWYEMGCGSNYSFKTLDPEGALLSSGSGNHAETLATQSYASSSTLSKNYAPLVEELRRKFSAAAAYKAVNAAHNDLRSKFDFAFTYDDPQIYFVKKHPAEDEFEANFEKTKAIFGAASAAADPKEILTKITPVIDFWKKYASANPGVDKDLIEIYVATNSNLAHVYYYLDEFEEAEKYARLVLAKDQKDRRTDRLLELLAKTKKEMDFHGIHTLHYYRDLSKALPPTKVKEIEAEIEQMQEDNNSLAGFIVMKGDTIKGFFVREKDHSEFQFGPNGNTKFVKDDVSMKEYDVSSVDVGAFSIGTRHFEKVKFSPCAKGKLEPAMHIMEQLYSSDKIRVYKYYPLSGALGNDQYEFAFRKKGDEMPLSLMDTRFLLWEKGLGEYFADCADLKTMSLSGGFKMNEDDLIKASRIYTEVCQ